MKYKDMTVHVTATEFRRRQGHFVDLAHRGATVIVNSRKGSFEVTPVIKEEDDESWLTPEVCAQIEEAWEQVKRGQVHEMKDVETLTEFLERLDREDPLHV